MHVQHDLSLTVIALIVIYLIGHFVISADSMQVAFYSIPIARKCKRLKIPTKHEYRENLSVRASLEIFAFIYVPKLLFLSMFELVLTNFVCMFVGYFVT